MTLYSRVRTMPAWSLFLATLACCLGGLVVAAVLTRPLTAAALATSAGDALAFRSALPPLAWCWGCAGRPTRSAGRMGPPGWSGRWSSPGTPWVEHLLRVGRPLPLAAQPAATFGDVVWAPAISLGVTLPLLLPRGGCARAAGGWRSPPAWPAPP